MSEVANTPFEMTLGDGSVVKGANIEEAFKTLAKMKEDTAAELRRQREEAESLRSEFQQYRYQQENPPAPPADPGKFSKDEYYRLLNSDPIEAQNYMDQFRFGVQDPVSAFNEMRNEVSNVRQQLVANEFLTTHGDFPPDNEAARKLTERVSSLVSRGIPFGLDTMNFAYDQLVKEGRITPVQVGNQVEEQVTPPPSLSGSGVSASDANEFAKVEAMSDKELEALMKSKGLLR